MSIAEKLQIIAENEQKVYEAGKQAEYDAFWDSFQNNGTRTNYESAFLSWDTSQFRPKYDLKGTTFASAFRFRGDVLDMSERLETLGVQLDTSGATNLAWAFFDAPISRIPKIDCSGVATIDSVFYNSPSLHTIDCLKLRDDGSNKFTYTFYASSNIKNITIEGVIGQSGFDMQWATVLTHDSIVSIINALSTTASGKSITLSNTAVNNAFEGGSEGSEWLNLIATKPNWTISLV